MADLTANRTPNVLGPPQVCFIKEPVGPLGLNTQAPNTTIYAGALCGYNTSNQIDNIDGANIVTVAGVSKSYTSNISTAPTGIGAPDGVQLQKGAISFLCDSTVSGTLKWGTDLYAVDNQTLSTSDGNGTRIRAGYFEGMDPSNTANCICQVGQASPLATASASATSTPANKARNIVTTLQAYGGSGTATLTETSNGAWSTQDGVTNATGDVIFIQAGTTNLTSAVDSGPWVISSLGGASSKWVLTRPDWWTNGSTMLMSATIDLGPEGTTWAGTSWRSFATPGSAVVGTNDPAFYVGRFTQSVTLVTGFVTKTNVGIRSTTETGVTFTPTNFSGAALTVSYRTGAYASGGAATAAGYAGTGSVSITALVAAGTFNTNDVGTGLLSIVNW